MLLLNFTHPIPADQVGRITQLTGQPVETVLTLPAQFDHAQPFIPQVQALIDQVPLTPEQWIILLPLAFIPAAVAEISKYFVRRSEKRMA